MGCGQSKSGKEKKPLPMRTNSMEARLPPCFPGVIQNTYTLGPVLGYGQFGTVRLAHSTYHPDEKFAVKTLVKSHTKIGPDKIRQEIAILFALDHPNIVRLYEVFEEPKCYHLVTEYCSGGELYDKLTAQGKYSEAEAAGLLRQMLMAINYLHHQGICHRDIKPENFMFESGELKLIDFGLSAKFSSNGNAELHSHVGTAYYAAPEVFKGCYGYKCDIWSAGIILYMMITGTLPFVDESTSGLCQQIFGMKLDFSDACWSNVSDLGKDLIFKMLTNLPTKRPTASEVLSHPWFQQSPSQSITFDPTVLYRLRQLRVTSRLQSAAFNVLAKHLTVKEMKEMKDMFVFLDKSNSGGVGITELQEALAVSGFRVSSEDMAQIMTHLDYGDSKKIKFSEFLTATLVSKAVISDEMMTKTFRYLDVNGEGHITAIGFKEAMTRCGRNITDEEAAGIIAESDELKQGKISYTDFLAVMKKRH